MKDKILTKAIAEQFLAGKIKDLESFTSIETEAAKALAAFKGNNLLLILTKNYNPFSDRL